MRKEDKKRIKKTADRKKRIKLNKEIKKTKKGRKEKNEGIE